ncbi:hypothetical protein EI53_00139 [Fusobacterium naviforme]|nr:hypothetical protein EI53_00139 [Fusobacterium naviforme]STO28488.1 Uncharacterised protein [Fusobacterium naviforme]
MLGIISFIIVCLMSLFVNFAGYGILKISQITSKMDAVVIVALITGGVSILGVVISSVVSKVIEYKQSIKKYLYEKKEEPYSKFIDMVYKMQENVKDNKNYSEQDMIKDVKEFSKQLTLWGSNKVIKKWLVFRERSQKTNISPTENLFILEDIIFEIRHDMGHKKRGLKRGDILAFFINDIKEYLPQINKRYTVDD